MLKNIIKYFSIQNSRIYVNNGRPDKPSSDIYGQIDYLVYLNRLGVSSQKKWQQINFYIELHKCDKFEIISCLRIYQCCRVKAKKLYTFKISHEYFNILIWELIRSV